MDKFWKVVCRRGGIAPVEYVVDTREEAISQARAWASDLHEEWSVTVYEYVLVEKVDIQ